MLKGLNSRLRTFSGNCLSILSPPINTIRTNENGNIFFMLFGAVAVVGTLGAVTVSTMRGPLSTMVEVQARTKAESEMAIASRLAMLDATETTSNGDCDGDGFVEPLEYEVGDGPSGGGLLPPGIASSRIDPWGTDYGYCVWDGGTIVNDTAGCDNNGTAGMQMLDGDGTGGDGYTIIALISAGADQVFQTTCTQGPPSLNKAGDDIVVEYTYASASAATDGLWNLKSGDPDTAEITKNLEVDGSASFTNGINLSNSSSALTLGAASMLFPTESTLSTCNAANNGLLRVNTATDPDTLELCDDPTGWVNAGAGGSVWRQNTSNQIYFNSPGTTEVGIGTTIPNNTLDVVGTLDVSGAVTFGDTLGVTGISSLAATTVDTLGATGAVDLDSTLNVDGTSTLADLNAQATTTTTLGATGAVDFDTTLNVDGTSTLADLDAQATTTTTLDTSGNTTIGGTLDVSGTATFNGTGDSIVITNDANLNGDIDVSGDYTSSSGNITLTNGDINADGADIDGRVTTNQLYVNNTDNFIPSTCASGSFNRWDGNSWECENDTAGGGGGGAIQENLSDDDGDTLIQLEETTDDDTIRFDTAGSQRVTIGPTGDVDIVGDGTSLNIDLNHGSGYPTITSNATHIRIVKNLIVDQKTFQITDSGNDRRTTMAHLNNTDFRMTTSQGSIFLQPAENVGIGNFTSDTIDSTLHIQTGDIRLDGGANNQAGCIRYTEGTGLQYSDDCTTFAAFNSISAAPGGTNTQVQYNDNGTFGGDSGLIYDDINKILTVGSTIVIEGQTGSASSFADLNDLDDVSAGAPNNGECLIYNSGSSTWESASCDAGSGLWTDNTTHVTRENFHIIDAGQTSDTTSLSDAGGAGTRAFYDTDSGALRGGSISASNNAWDDGNIGNNSLAWGSNAEASGSAAFAFGNNATASGYTTMAVGNNASANSSGGIAFGDYASASSQDAFAFGAYSRARKLYSLALGYGADADGTASVAIGRKVKVTGNYSQALSAGEASGTAPVVSGGNSVGVFLGDQSGYDLSTSNRMALVGGDFLIDDDGTAGSQGCIRFVEGTGLQFSHDCTTFATMGSAGTSLDDADGDTKVEVEQIADEDKIHFITDGIERLRISSTGLFIPTNAGDLRVSTGTIYGPNSSTPMDLTFNQGDAGFGILKNECLSNDCFAEWRMFNSADTGIRVGVKSTGFVSALYAANSSYIESDGSDLSLIMRSTTAPIRFLSGDTSTPTEHMRIQSNGNIGIGDFRSDTADSTMHIQTGDIRLDGGAANEAGCIRFDDTNDVLQFSNDCSTFTAFGGGSGAFENASGVVRNTGTNASDDFVFGSPQLADDGNTDHDKRMFFDKSKGAFRVGRVNSTQWDESSIGTYSIGMGNSVTASGSHSFAMGSSTTASGAQSTAIGFLSSATNTSSVAIGSGVTTSGEASISMGQEVTTSGNNSFGLGLGNASATAPAVSGNNSFGVFMGDQSSVNVSSDNVMAIMGGNLGINNVAPDVALDVTGDIEYTGTLTDVSDMRLKENIIPLTKTGRLLNRIDQINTYSFTMKGDEKSRPEYGVMAQELEEIFPDLVQTANDDMGTKSVNYIGLIPPVIEATKELKAENEVLKAQMNDLSDQVALLNKMAGNNVDKASMEGYLMLLIGMLFGSGIMFAFQRRKNA